MAKSRRMRAVPSGGDHDKPIDEPKPEPEQEPEQEPEPEPEPEEPEPEPEPEPTIRSGLSLRSWVDVGSRVAAFVVLAAIGGFLWAKSSSDVFEARSDVLFELTAEQPTGFLREDRNLATQMLLLRSRRIVAPIAEARQLDIDATLEDLSVELLDASEVIRVSFRDESRDAALAVVRDVVAGYVELAGADPRGAAEAFLNDQLTTVASQISQLDSATQDEPTRDRLAALRDRDTDLRRQLNELTVAKLVTPQPQVLVPAFTLTDPVAPRPLRSAAIAGLAALFPAAAYGAVLLRRRAS